MTTSVHVVNLGPSAVTVDITNKDVEGNDKVISSKRLFAQQSDNFVVYENGQEVKVRETH